ncbi:MAG: hypothetical protein CGU29_03570 [Candidatus Dactylopiibacterium carminicum]|uniref:Diguanylate cyclase n=1 Tax=Candidatus Dactylopiibacterium carminicum TaxID=857335 RepID=A0A272EWC0_9RHOO|nr:hypothetical protein BGI27_07265 [Candidatus Dactylopiibacterium carminicum]PAS94403.1 MAG: hypothetical protein CGU29_03570 [Candidatus Dactylopiibacterium carminicum]
MVAQTQDQDELEFAGDAVEEDRRGNRRPWRILIVDDDPDVHTTTTFALRNAEILGCPLAFLHADSASQARELLKRDQEIAVILLDVVMEQEDSGLQLVRFIRDELGMSETRIILRTGQPGYAPEMDAIRDYDINDYKTKSELTRNRLYTALTAAVRSYHQIRTINQSRRGLDLIVRASGELLALSGIRSFAAGVITQMSSLLGVAPEGLICVQRPQEGSRGEDALVIAAAGRYTPLINQSLGEIGDTGVRASIERCLDEGRHIFTPDHSVLFFGSRSQRNMAAYLDAPLQLDADWQQLLEVFCANIAIGLENTLLFSRLQDFAYLDTLTGLPNRRSLINSLDDILLGSERGRYTLVLMDLDGFAETNDAIGHKFGDALLRAVAQRLRNLFGNHCTIAHLSADTFAVLGYIELLLPASLQAAFRDAFVIDGQELMVGASMGIAHLIDVEGNGAEALKDAYLALRRAKLHARGEYMFFTRDMGAETRERSRLLQALRLATERQRLFLCYQPQINLQNGKVIGIEALLRWRAEDGRLIEPARFIPIAEHSGMIVGIGEWVMRTACFQQAELARQGFTGLSMAINISVGQLRHPHFLASLQSALHDSGVDPTLIELEVTESIAMGEADFLARPLEAVRALGVKVAVDDFGTGFSSLSYLQRLQVDRLKIDRSFIADLEHDERAQRIPELVIQLAHRLGLHVLAEGVETPEQARLLTDLACDEAQGYLYARPMESHLLVNWLHQHQQGNRHGERR